MSRAGCRPFLSHTVMNHRRVVRSLVLVATALGAFALLAGCGKKATHEPPEDQAGKGHVHAAKHGGVAVELGEHEYQIEFTVGETPGTIRAYIMDGHMEEFVRIEAATFAATAAVDGQTIPLVFAAVADPATGEKIGDSSLFEAKVAGLNAGAAVELKIPALLIKGRTYTNIAARLSP
jgi:hypothetical protein